MILKDPKKNPKLISFKPDSEYTYVRIKVVDGGTDRPMKRSKKHRPAWDVLGGLSASVFLPDHQGGKRGGAHSESHTT